MGNAYSSFGLEWQQNNAEYCQENIKVEFDTHDGQPYDKDGRYDKKDKSSLFSGAHETLVSEGGEKDLNLVLCKKNPGHTKFVPVDDFNISHLPEGYHDDYLVEYIKATATLTVRVAVTMTSTERPEFWPNTKQSYAFYNMRGTNITRVGTGKVTNINMWTEKDIKRYKKGTCPCRKCQTSGTPSKLWGVVKIYTARHVVFNDFEARHTTCRLFYDKQDSPLVTLDGWTVREADTEGDWCWFECMTCDVDLLENLEKMVGKLGDLWKKVDKKYKYPRDENTLTWIVSHPHGCTKKISVGHWTHRSNVTDGKTRYTYTTCTCPGSSGAYVHPAGYDVSLWYDNHVHCGVNSEGQNFSGTAWDIV